jgi:hypothetical protein
MRHSTIDSTMQVYTDPRLLDVACALAALPALELASRQMGGSQSRGLEAGHESM